MLHGVVILEDSLVTFQAPLPAEIQADPACNTDWAVTFGDTVTGKTERRYLSKDQLAAVFALMFGLCEDDEPESELSQRLYTLAEAAVEGLEQELRPFP